MVLQRHHGGMLGEAVGLRQQVFAGLKAADIRGAGGHVGAGGGQLGDDAC
jgi:hypothetical protein